jgi:hypothetical protein
MRAKFILRKIINIINAIDKMMTLIVVIMKMKIIIVTLLEDDGSGHDNIDKDEDWMVEKKNNAMN